MKIVTGISKKEVEEIGAERDRLQSKVKELTERNDFLRDQVKDIDGWCYTVVSEHNKREAGLVKALEAMIKAVCDQNTLSMLAAYEQSLAAIAKYHANLNKDFAETGVVVDR